MRHLEDSLHLAVEAARGERTPAGGPSVSIVNLALYFAALEHWNRIDPEVVPSVSWKTGKAKQRINKAPAEPSKI
jgi:hypothetical protein